MFYFNVSILFFFLLEEDSDEIKIGTSCKNGGCSKVYITKFVLRLEVKFLFYSLYRRGRQERGVENAVR